MGLFSKHHDPEEIDDNEVEDILNDDAPPESVEDEMNQKHTEALIKAESDRIINMVLKHIKDINSSLTEKVEELEKLTKNASVVQKTIEHVKIDENVVKNNKELVLEYDIKINEKKLTAQLSKILSEIIDQRIDEFKKSLKDEIYQKLSSTKTVFKSHDVVSATVPITQNKIVKKPLKELSKEEYFYLEDGSVIKSVRDLAEEFEKINDDLYSKHVTENKNDFSAWVRDVYKEPGLADSLDKTKNREQARQIVKIWLTQN